jgi:hypothetical protein
MEQLPHSPTYHTRVVAGNGHSGISGDEGPATEAQLGSPTGIAFDREENLYFFEPDHKIIRKIVGKIP